MSLNRRDFLQQFGGWTAGALLLPDLLLNATQPKKMFFEISLAEWSFHNALYDKKMTNLDFPVKARKDFDIGIVEYVSTFFEDKQNSKSYLKELLMRCKDNGVKNHLIMIDGMGELATLDKKERDKAVENHKQWVEAAKFLGCKTIRVNAGGKGTPEEMHKAAVDGLSKLATFAKPFKINIIVENHGGNSSNGQWLAAIMKEINMPNCGTLPDFGNFCVRWDSGKTWEGACVEEYDRYKGVMELMPYAKGVSAKSMDFDAQGNCIETDYNKMLKIVKDAGFRGYIGIEYAQAGTIPEDEGVRLTKALLEKVGGQLS